MPPLPAPAAPAAPSAWAVGLRTIGARVEAELGLAALLDLISTNHSFTADWNAAVAWWNGLVPAALQLTGNEAGDAPRALDRRILAARGLRDGATSLLAAINRAEDFIYIETPALDDLSLGDTGDTLQLWQALIARMAARPALRVILCVPVFLAAGAPKALQRVRDNLLLTLLQRGHAHAVLRAALGRVLVQRAQHLVGDAVARADLVSTMNSSLPVRCVRSPLPKN